MHLVLDSLGKVGKQARSAAQTAAALSSTARGTAPALLKQAPHLVGAMAGSALSLGTGLVRRLTDHEPAAASAPGEAAAHDVGAPGSAAAAVDAAVRQVADHVRPGEVLTHDELPLADFDHLTIGALRTRIRSLDLESLVQLRSYERVHANRLPVLTALENRIARVQAEGADSGLPAAATAE